MRLVKRKEFERLFRKYGARLVPGGKHFRLEREVDGKLLIYTVALCKGGKEVLEVYVKHGRRALMLTPEDGVTDEDFAS